MGSPPNWISALEMRYRQSITSLIRAPVQGDQVGIGNYLPYAGIFRGASSVSAPTYHFARNAQTRKLRPKSNFYVGEREGGNFQENLRILRR